LSVALVLTCAAASIAQTPQIESKYDRFEGKTNVQLDFMQVTGGKFDGIYLNAAYQCLGDVLYCKPERVYLGVLIAIKDYRYDLPANLIVLADGEHFPLGKMLNLGTVDMLPGWKIGGTSLLIGMPYETFQKVAKAKKVEMRLDSTEVELQEAHRSAFKDFALLMYPKDRPK
jgi:hypothetical protein